MTSQPRISTTRTVHIDSTKLNLAWLIASLQDAAHGIGVESKCEVSFHLHPGDRSFDRETMSFTVTGIVE